MLTEFLSGKNQLQAGKIRATLERKFINTNVGVMTMAEAIEEWTSKPECKLICECGRSRKINGERHVTKPAWFIFTMGSDGYMSGPVIPKIGAEYANWLMNGKFSLEVIQGKADAEYAKYGRVTR